MESPLATIPLMRKSPKPPKPNDRMALPEYPDLIWGGIALCAWVGETVWHAGQGTPFSAAILGKGFLLLAEATVIYLLCAIRGFSFLGLFPLLWLSVSSFQWEICAGSTDAAWCWLSIFLGLEILVLVWPEGKRLFAILAPLWVFLSWLLSFSILLPFSFLTASAGRFKNSSWLRWGGSAMGVLCFLYFRGWRFEPSGFLHLYDLLVGERFLAFFFLGWLGLIAFPRKGTYRHILFPAFLLTLGAGLWPDPIFPPTIPFLLLKWLLVFFAGFGLESFRRDLMDPTWHGRAVWFGLGVAFFGGVLR